MICNKKLEALFDAALRATEEPVVKPNASVLMPHPLPGSATCLRPEDGMSFEEQSISPREPISFAPAFWKTAL
jgi:hypothetical protein